MKSDDINRMIEEMSANKTPPCKTDPRAPHGFDRNASHSADRYVCECEGWEPPEPINKNITNIPKTKPAATLKDIQRAVDALEKRINK